MGVSNYRISGQDQKLRGKRRHYFLLLITLVMAWRIIVPAFSISFLVRPVVTHTFRAGGTTCLGSKLSSRVFSRVIRTPLARDCESIRNRLQEGYNGRKCKTYLIHGILEQELLVIGCEPLSSHNLGLDDQDENRVLRRAGAVNPVTTGIQLSPHGLGEFPKL